MLRASDTREILRVALRPSVISFAGGLLGASGGLFIWVELPEPLDARRLLARCLERDVAFVPGDCFFPGGGHANTLRLNFSNMCEERIDEGISRLGQAIRDLVAERAQRREPIPAV